MMLANHCTGNDKIPYHVLCFSASISRYWTRKKKRNNATSQGKDTLYVPEEQSFRQPWEVIGHDPGA